jgi:hypothetical protein
MDGWVDGWMDGWESRVKDCLQQSKIKTNNFKLAFISLLRYLSSKLEGSCPEINIANVFLHRHPLIH